MQREIGHEPAAGRAPHRILVEVVDRGDLCLELRTKRRSPLGGEGFATRSRWRIIRTIVSRSLLDIGAFPGRGRWPRRGDDNGVDRA